MLDNLTYRRRNLSRAYCDSLQGKGIANATSGLFLAGPRRVGKSTFLKEDLIPEAHARDWITVYVDLWADKLANPALLITESVKTCLSSYKGKLFKLIKKMQLQKISLLKTVELDFAKSGMPANITLVDLLTDLLHLSGKPVLLIIDEAQHALTTLNGLNAMFAIKSARDQVNISHKPPNLMLVLTGSNRDKLAELVIKKNQPFFGSEVTAFPLLGRDYTDFFTDTVNKSLSADNQFDKDSMWEAFQLIGHRPEVLRQIVGKAAISNEAQSFSTLLKQDAFIWHNQIWEEFENDFNALPPLHRTILTLLIEQGRIWSPFSAESMKYYKEAINQSTLSVSSVQTAISALREHGFIWQSSRGAYALEDESFVQWFVHTRGNASKFRKNQ